MRYLVVGDPTDVPHGPPGQPPWQYIESRFMPSLEACMKLEKEGKIAGGGMMIASRGFVVIIDVPSNEEATRFLMGLPFWHNYKFTVTPLESFEHRLQVGHETVAKLKAGTPH